MEIHLNVTLTDYEVDQLKIGLQRYSDYLMSQNRFLTASMVDVILDKFGLLIESR